MTKCINETRWVDALGQTNKKEKEMPVSVVYGS